jgi:hypothetical protein
MRDTASKRNDLAVPQVAEERWIAGVCGNPLCARSVGIPISDRLDQDSKGTKQGKRYVAEPGRVVKLGEAKFCGLPCQRFTEAYAAMLGDPLQVGVWAKKGVIGHPRKVLASNMQPLVCYDQQSPKKVARGNCQL